MLLRSRHKLSDRNRNQTNFQLRFRLGTVDDISGHSAQVNCQKYYYLVLCRYAHY